MSFGKSQLLKYGWNEGKGLGRHESGIRDPLKVKLKFDKTGVGHDASEEFTFHWWDQVYNMNAQNLTVQRSEKGVRLKMSDAVITSTKKNPLLLQKKLLYGHFVQGSRLNPEKKESAKEEASSSEDEESPCNSSSAGLFGSLSDEQLLKMCNGQTAHKGARHGISMRGKLSRIESQDTALKNTSAQKKPSGETLIEKSKKKHKHPELSTDDFHDQDYLNNSHKENLSLEKKLKKKKKSKHVEMAEVEDEPDSNTMTPKKKKKKSQDNNIHCLVNENGVIDEKIDNGLMDRSVHGNPSEEKVLASKKKKKKSRESSPVTNEEASYEICKKKKRKQKTQLEISTEPSAHDEHSYDHFVAKKKKKKKKH